MKGSVRKVQNAPVTARRGRRNHQLVAGGWRLVAGDRFWVLGSGF
jgi:hypothetical protein